MERRASEESDTTSVSGKRVSAARLPVRLVCVMRGRDSACTVCSVCECVQRRVLLLTVSSCTRSPSCFVRRPNSPFELQSNKVALIGWTDSKKMSFRSSVAYPPSETDDQQPHSLGYSSQRHERYDQSLMDLSGSQNPLNASFGTSFYAAPSRSYSVQDIATLPGLAPQGYAANYPSYNQYNSNPAGMHPQNGSYQAASSQYVNPAYAQWLVQYKEWYEYVQNVQRERLRQLQPISERARLTPHRYPHRHTRVSFGGANQFLTAKGTVVSIQQIDPSLIDLGEEIQVTTWPGPLIKGETKKDEVLEYIRTREGILKQDQSPESYFKAHERKQIWSLLSMIVRQNGTLSGADLSELLLANNENEFESPEEGDDIAKLRRYLTLGQRKTALEFAQKTGLWGHVTSLVLFSSPVPVSLPSGDSLAIQFSKVVSKFMSSTLNREDPLFILYRSLLTKIQTSVTTSTATTNSISNSKQQQVTTDTLQQFAILLANDCDVNPSVKDYSRASELLKLIVNVKSNVTQHIVNLANLDLEHDGSEKSVKDLEHNYSDELVFINEIWEFSRSQTEFIERLVPLKTLLASRLFDFGHVNQASRYCYAIRQYFTYYHYYFPGKTVTDSSIDWETVIDFVTDLECRIYGFDVTKGAKDQSSVTEKKVPEAEEEKSTVAETDGSQEDDTDVSDGEETESELDKRPELVHHKNPASRQQQHHHGQPLQRQDSQMSSASGATSGERSRAASNISQANTGTNAQLRTRTLSKEAASPPTSPVKTAPSPQSIPSGVTAKKAPEKTFQPLSINESRSSAALGQMFFVPPANNAEAVPEFDFVSSFAPNQSVDPPASPNFGEDSHEVDGRRSSATPFVHNSTAVPGMTSPGQFPNVFSPIASPDSSDQMNGFNQSHQNRMSSYSQEAQQPNHQPQQSAHQQQGTTTGTGQNGESPIDQQDRSIKKGSSWMSNLIRKVVPPGAKQAVLPDDRNPSIVYDEKLKMWIDKNDPSGGQQLAAIRNGPPRMSNATGMTSATSMPMLSSLPPAAASQQMPNGAPNTNNFSFMTGPNRRKPQYVDVWQQQQKQQQSKN